MVDEEYLHACQQATSALLRDDVPLARRWAHEAFLALAQDVEVAAGVVALERDLRSRPPRPGQRPDPPRVA